MPTNHWLLSIEGTRGTAYFVGTVSLVAPSLLAYYLLSPQELLTTSWPLAALLSASVGGSVSIVLIAFSKPLHQLFDVEDADTANFTLVSSIALSFATQTVAAVFCVLQGWSFHGYIIAAFFFAILIPGGTSLGTWFHKRFFDKGNQNKKENDSTESQTIP